MTLLLGPPGAGKSTLMKTLAGQMDKDLKVANAMLFYLDRALDFLLTSRGLVLCAVRRQHHIQRP